MTAISARNVSLRFGAVDALSDVSLTVEENSLSAIIGPNGAGKTSFFNCLSGLYRPTSGSVEVLGEPVAARKPHEVSRLGCARMFQNLALFDNLSVIENLLIGAHDKYRTSLVSKLFMSRRARREEAAQLARIEWIVDFLHLERYRQAPVLVLPYGVRKRVELGRAMAMDPRVILLDEPAAGLNQEETEDMARYLLDLHQQLGLTLVLIEHELGMVMDLADRIFVLDFGRKIAEGTPDEVRKHPDVIRAYIGEEGAA